MKQKRSGSSSSESKLEIAMQLANVLLKGQPNQQDILSQVKVAVLTASRSDSKLSTKRIVRLTQDTIQSYDDRLIRLPGSMKKAMRQYSRILSILMPKTFPSEPQQTELYEKTVVAQCFFKECSFSCEPVGCPFFVFTSGELRKILQLCSTGHDNLEALGAANGYNEYEEWLRVIENLQTNQPIPLDGLYDPNTTEAMVDLLLIKDKCDRIDSKLFRLLLLCAEFDVEDFEPPKGWASKEIKEILDISSGEIRVLLRKAKEALHDRKRIR